VRLDLNADVAESFGRWRLGDDDALLPLLTSANVACGFHAGDARTIRETVARCAARNRSGMIVVSGWCRRSAGSRPSSERIAGLV